MNKVTRTFQDETYAQEWAEKSEIEKIKILELGYHVIQGDDKLNIYFKDQGEFNRMKRMYSGEGSQFEHTNYKEFKERPAGTEHDPNFDRR